MQELIDFLEKKGLIHQANSLKSLKKGGTPLSLSNTNIGDEGAKAIGESLKTNNSITQLVLSSNQIWAEGAKAIGEGLKTNNSITQLCLQVNQIGDEGAKAIGEGLKINNSITQLWLGYNKIGDEGAKAIGEGLKINNSITQLDLQNNQIGAEGAKAVSEGLKTNTSLTVLYLFQNQIGDEKIKEINEYLQRNINIAKGDNPQAEVLNTQGDSFCKDGKYDKAIEKYNEAIAIIKKPLYITNKTNAEKNYEKQQVELVAKQKAELEARQKAELEAKQRAELEAKQKAELEAKQKAELEAKQKQEEEQQQQFNKLISAIQENKVEEAKNLIQKINTQTLSKIDDDGNTILHYAAEKNIPELYELLTSKVAPEFVNIANKAGKTALEVLAQIQEEKQKMAEYMAHQQIIIQETMKLIAEGNDKITEKNDKGILILGKTGAGKSTLAYYLAKEELTVFEDEQGTLRLEPKNNKNGIIVNHSMNSETKIPGKLIDTNGTTIWDCPGFSDTRDIAQEIANAFYIQRLFETSKQLKFILAISDIVLEDKFDIIIPIFDQFSKTFTNAEPLKNSLSLIVTKAATNKKVIHLQKTIEKISQQYSTHPKISEILEILRESVYPFVRPLDKGDIPNSDLLTAINDKTEYVDLSIYPNLANIVISEKSREYANELLKVTYNNINNLVDIFTKAISDPNKCMTNIDNNVFIKSYDVVESLPKASPSVKHAPFNRLPVHNDSIDPFLKLDQIKSLQKILFENLSNNNNSNSAKDNFLKALEVFEEFIINDDELKQKIQNYAYVFKQQIDINKCFSQVCGNKPVNYSHMEQALQKCKEAINMVLETEIKRLEVEDGRIRAEDCEPDIAYYKKAIEYLDQYKDDQNCIKQKANAYYNIGRIYDNQGNYSQAALNYTKALELNEQLPDIYERLGEILFSNKQYVEAIKCFKVVDNSMKIENCFKELIKLNPNTLLDKGDYYFSISLFEKARKCYKDAFSISKDNNFKLAANQKIAVSLEKQAEKTSEIINLINSQELYHYNEVNTNELNQAINKIKEPIQNLPIVQGDLAHIACNDNHEVHINGDVLDSHTL